jgi:CheY-like chemotaxis protein
MKYIYQRVNESRDDEFAEIRASSAEEFMPLRREWLISVGLDTTALLPPGETLISKGQRVLLAHLAELAPSGFWRPVIEHYRKSEPEPPTRGTLGPVDLPEPPPRSPRLLIVDSALPVARVLATFLDPFEVEIATSGADALVRLAASPVIDAVLCDLHVDDLDHLDGRDLYRLACARSPELRGRFVFMTGASSPPPGFDESSAAPVLRRPFDPDLLLATLQKLLLRHPPRVDA